MDRTDRQKLPKIDKPLKPLKRCGGDSFLSLFVSTRIDDPKTGSGVTFVRSNCKREHHCRDDAV
ncbi:MULTISPECIES: hypothetical protein [Burkholderiaceae]|uniref:hypothetical protein n=1 Tax=Burkholderiaceae TaxID=119060 RepID=UPI00111570C8|nr:MULTISPECIES: hypothetical protein [Burkholderiaceae]MCG1019953.1 hypothetical protein [Mycetohabitans sp. B4]